MYDDPGGGAGVDEPMSTSQQAAPRYSQYNRAPNTVYVDCFFYGFYATEDFLKSYRLEESDLKKNKVCSHQEQRFDCMTCIGARPPSMMKRTRSSWSHVCDLPNDALPDRAPLKRQYRNHVPNPSPVAPTPLLSTPSTINNLANDIISAIKKISSPVDLIPDLLLRTPSFRSALSMDNERQ